MADGVVVAEGTAEEIKASGLPFVTQFVWGEIDGPVSFHYPARPTERIWLWSSCMPKRVGNGLRGWGTR